MLLQAVLEKATKIPSEVKECALASLDADVLVKGQRHQTSSGQLMGDRLSFPLLCLMNFVAFKHALGRKVPLAINGDDIVFRCRRVEAEEWFQSVADSGLVVSKGKTLVNSSFLSLNSNIFVAGMTRVHQVPFVRSKSIFRQGEDSLAFGDRYRSSFVGQFSGQALSLARNLFFSFNRNPLFASNCSLRRGHMLNWPPGVIKYFGLTQREEWYLSLPHEADRLRQKGEGLPEGMKSVISDRMNRKLSKDEDREVRDLFISDAWELKGKWRTNGEVKNVLPGICRFKGTWAVKTISRKTKCRPSLPAPLKRGKPVGRQLFNLMANKRKGPLTVRNPPIMPTVHEAPERTNVPDVFEDFRIENFRAGIGSSK